MMFIRLNRYLIDEVRELDAAVAQVRARVAKSAQIFVATQEERSNMSVDLTLLIEFRCVVTVSTPAVWLARENIKRLTPRPCINVEYSHGVVYMEESP